MENQGNSVIGNQQSSMTGRLCRLTLAKMRRRINADVATTTVTSAARKPRSVIPPVLCEMSLILQESRRFLSCEWLMSWLKDMNGISSAGMGISSDFSTEQEEVASFCPRSFNVEVGTGVRKAKYPGGTYGSSSTLTWAVGYTLLRDRCTQILCWSPSKRRCAWGRCLWRIPRIYLPFLHHVGRQPVLGSSAIQYYQIILRYT